MKNEYSWEEFYERYTKNHEEFLICYKNYEIWLVYEGRQKFLYTIKDINKPNVPAIPSIFYISPYELLANARFAGKLLEEIWDDVTVS